MFLDQLNNFNMVMSMGSCSNHAGTAANFQFVIGVWLAKSQQIRDILEELVVM
jgi:hypothetical protein